MTYTSETLLKSTTVLAIHHKGEFAIGADGQATMGDTIAKSSVKKLRKLFGGTILAGFAGSTADAFTLLERFEEKLSLYAGNMYRSLLGLAKDWRHDKYLRKLEALIIVANKEQMFTVTGVGDIMKPDNDTAAIGSGGNYAHAAALALKKYASHLSGKEIVKASLTIAADMCIYTNHNIIIETLAGATA